MSVTWESVRELLIPFFKMILILLIGHFIIIYVLKIVKRALNKGNLDDSFKAFLIKTINIVLHILIILSALNTIGISTSGILAAISAAAVAVAVALKDSLSNVAGGILLLIAPRFSTGDYIETDNDAGKVLNVDLLHTTIKTVDNKQVSIPNGVLINSHIINYSRETLRRVDITFPISYETDINKAKEIITKVITKHPLVLTEPEEPVIRVLSYGDSAVNVITRTWCDNSNYWSLYFDLTEQVREVLEKESITFPYNQLDVRIRKESE